MVMTPFILNSFLLLNNHNRAQLASDIFRIFCFFDEDKLVILANGFQKKTQKTPKNEIEKALKIKAEYEAEK